MSGGQEEEVEEEQLEGERPAAAAAAEGEDRIDVKGVRRGEMRHVRGEGGEGR